MSRHEHRQALVDAGMHWHTRPRWANDLRAHFAAFLPARWVLDSIVMMYSVEEDQEVISCVLTEHTMGWQTTLRSPLSEGWNHTLLTQAQTFVDECMQSTLPPPPTGHGEEPMSCMSPRCWCGGERGRRFASREV